MVNNVNKVSSVVKGKASPYSIIERRVPELIPVLGSQPAGDVSHKRGGRLPLLSARPRQWYSAINLYIIFVFDHIVNVVVIACVNVVGRNG